MVLTAAIRRAHRSDSPPHPNEATCRGMTCASCGATESAEDFEDLKATMILLASLNKDFQGLQEMILSLAEAEELDHVYRGATPASTCARGNPS